MKCILKPSVYINPVADRVEIDTIDVIIYFGEDHDLHSSLSVKKYIQEVIDLKYAYISDSKALRLRKALLEYRITSNEDLYPKHLPRIELEAFLDILFDQEKKSRDIFHELFGEMMDPN